MQQRPEPRSRPKGACASPRESRTIADGQHRRAHALDSEQKSGLLHGKDVLCGTTGLFPAAYAVVDAGYTRHQVLGIVVDDVELPVVVAHAPCEGLTRILLDIAQNHQVAVKLQ